MTNKLSKIKKTLYLYMNKIINKWDININTEIEYA